jgi:hypothetical protein
MARLLVWGAAVMNVLAALAFVGVLLLRSMAAADNPPGFDDAARSGSELGLGLLLACILVVLSPPVFALRWRLSPPASQRSVGAVTGLALGPLYVVGGLVAAVSTQPALNAVAILVLLVIPNLFALMAAWNWRPWARQEGRSPWWPPR